MAVAAPESLPPVAEGRVRRRLWAVLGLAILVAAGALLLFLQRPQGQFFYPRCTFHSLTGWLCPGCGGLRAAHELLHGRPLAAARGNALFVVLVPLAVTWWGSRRWRRQPVTLSPRAVWLGFLVIVAFTFLRNLPFAPFSLLAP